jgi:hypothetical protein
MPPNFQFPDPKHTGTLYAGVQELRQFQPGTGPVPGARPTLGGNPPGKAGRPRHLGRDENDPKSVAKVLKRMGQEMGEDFPGEVDAMVEEAMDSQSAEAGGETDL